MTPPHLKDDNGQTKHHVIFLNANFQKVKKLIFDIEILVPFDTQRLI